MRLTYVPSSKRNDLRPWLAPLITLGFLGLVTLVVAFVPAWLSLLPLVMVVALFTILAWAPK
jgi:hypothetical protein